MNNDSKLVRVRHLESVAGATKDFVINQIDNIATGGVLDTVPATVNGGMWYELDNGEPVMKFHYGSCNYLLTPTVESLDPQLSIDLESGSEDITSGWIAYNNRYLVNYLGNGTITVSDGGKNVCHYNSSTRIIAFDPYGGEITMTVSLSGAPPYVAASVSYTFWIQGGDEPT